MRWVLARFTPQQLLRHVNSSLSPETSILSEGTPAGRNSSSTYPSSGTPILPIHHLPFESPSPGRTSSSASPAHPAWIWKWYRCWILLWSKLPLQSENKRYVYLQHFVMFLYWLYHTDTCLFSIYRQKNYADLQTLMYCWRRMRRHRVQVSDGCFMWNYFVAI